MGEIKYVGVLAGNARYHELIMRCNGKHDGEGKLVVCGQLHLDGWHVQIYCEECTSRAMPIDPLLRFGELRLVD